MKLTLFVLYIFSHIDVQSQNTLSDGTATVSACPRLLIAGMLPAIQAMKMQNICPINSDHCLP